MNDIMLISEKDKASCLNNLQTTFDSFVLNMDKIQETYQTVTLSDLQIFSYSNFRDALFHFSKIDSQSDFIKISQQVYALEEHLHRSLKDSVVYLFYTLTSGIESYLSIIEILEKFDLNLDESEKELYSKIVAYRSIYSVFMDFSNKYSLNSINKCLLLKLKDSYENSTKAILRNILHQAKNKSFNIRNISLKIERPLEDEANLDSYLKFFNEAYAQLNAIGLMEYIYYANSLKLSLISNITKPQKTMWNYLITSFFIL